MTTTILGLPTLEAAQNQKYLTSNQALSYIDALVNLTIFNRTTTVPPVSPSEGDRYIVGSSATGVWSGEDNKIAVFIGSNWIFFTPAEGWRTYDQGANEHLLWNGSDWILQEHSHIGEVMKLTPLASAPSSPSAGWVYFDSSDNKMKCYDGTTWNNLF